MSSPCCPVWAWGIGLRGSSSGHWRRVWFWTVFCVRGWESTGSAEEHRGPQGREGVPTGRRGGGQDLIWGGPRRVGRGVPRSTWRAGGESGGLREGGGQKRGKRGQERRERAKRNEPTRTVRAEGRKHLARQRGLPLKELFWSPSFGWFWGGPWGRPRSTEVHHGGRGRVPGEGEGD